MKRFGDFSKEAAIVAATTLGAGIFALPYVFAVSGWAAGIFYLAAFAVVVTAVHFIYFKTLRKVKEKNRLLGLAEEYLGGRGFGLSLFAILGGLFLTLVVYLILGGNFMKVLFPSLPPIAAVFLFWIISIAPLLVKERRSLKLEVVGIILMSAIIIFIFFSSDYAGALFSLKQLEVRNIFLPLGAVFFSLAGWTAVEPVYGLERDKVAPRTGFSEPYFGMAAGTALTALLYFLFVAGIIGSSMFIAPDTVSGLGGWPALKIQLLGILGLFAIWTSYLPIGLEIKNSLKSDLGRGGAFSLTLVLFLPLVLFLAGLNNFLRVIGLVGGVFVALQYLLIVLVGKKVLRPAGVNKFLFNFASFIFVIAAIYEIYYFVVG